MLFQPYQLASSPFPTPGSCPCFWPCSLLSGLLPTLPQERYGLLHADSDCFWLPSLIKAFLANVTKLSLEWECYLNPWESLNQEVFPPNFSSWDSNPFSSPILSPQRGQGWSRRIVSGKRRWPLPPSGGMPPVLLRAWLKSSGRDQVSPALGTEEGQRPKPSGTPKSLDAENASPWCLNAFL